MERLGLPHLHWKYIGYDVRTKWHGLLVQVHAGKAFRMLLPDSKLPSMHNRLNGLTLARGTLYFLVFVLMKQQSHSLKHSASPSQACDMLFK